jgi:hypothetical protein
MHRAYSPDVVVCLPHYYQTRKRRAAQSPRGV